MKKTLDLEVVTKGEYVSMSMNLNKWHAYLNGDLNTILNLGNVTITNSVFLQVFKFGNNKKNLWDLVGSSTAKTINETIASNNLTGLCTDQQNCKKYLADDWGLIQFNIPRKNCSVVAFESLSRYWLFICSFLNAQALDSAL